jgi:hypothetical protein
MIVVSAVQAEVLRKQSLRRFEDDLVRSIAFDFGPKFELLGEAEIRRLIRSAIDGGAKLGIRNQGAVAVLAELMVQFGERFQHSPERAWANKMLCHPDLPDYIKVDVARKRMTANTLGRTLMPAAARPAKG